VLNGENKPNGDGGAKPPFTPPSGILVIDKTRGPTSHQVTAWVGQMLGVEVGHSGTLDPQVSGVLLVMTGKAVRLAPLLLRHEKEYICLMRLHGDSPRSRIEAVAREFTGKIYQRPPRRSAVARNLRIRTIHSISILDVRGRLVLFKVRCDAGTYIRSLCHHMGLIIGTGAHMQELRRTMSGVFDEQSACTLQDLADAVTRCLAGECSEILQMIRPAEAGISDQPCVVLRDAAVDAVTRGAGLAAVGIVSNDAFHRRDLVVMKTRTGEFIGIGEALTDSSKFKPGDNGLVIAPRTVFMTPGTYPKGWKTHTKKA
jgi:predicted rRNA pseudouridine synthase